MKYFSPSVRRISTCTDKHDNLVVGFVNSLSTICFRVTCKKLLSAWFRFFSVFHLKLHSEMNYSSFAIYFNTSLKYSQNATKIVKSLFATSNCVHMFRTQNMKISDWDKIFNTFSIGKLWTFNKGILHFYT